MNIDSQGYTLDTLDDILSAFETFLRDKYGDDFYIQAKSVISNIFTTVAFQEMSLQEQIAFLIKQFDPEQAEDEFQDALYERLLVYRIKAEKTVVERTIVGAVGLTVAAGEVSFRNKATLDEFVNKDTVTIGGDGSVVTDFECVLFGAIDLPENAEIEVLSMPIGVTGIETGEEPKIDMGRARETNEEYRVRFRKEKSRNAKATRNANYTNLGQYVDDMSYLNIVDKKTDLTMNAGEVKIIVNHNTTDTIFANAIFNTVADGIDTIGTSTQTLTDDAGESVTINWINASFTQIAIEGDLKAKSGFFYQSVANAVKSSILEYVQKRIYGLGQTVYANEFIIPAYEVEGVENLTNLQVGIYGSGSMSDSQTVIETSLAMFNTDWITLNEI